MVLDKKTIAMASGPNFAAFTTLFNDGSPQTHIMWVDTDGEYLLINTEIHRAKYLNTTADKRVNVMIWKHDDTFKFACTLPGQITHSNADSTSNDTLWWSFSSEKFIDEDFIIEASSIIYFQNRIQRIIVGSALIILLGLILISKQRKNS